MRLATSLRWAWLEARASAASLGAFPVVVGLLFVSSSAFQEPSIFRSEGLELTWPSILATSDVLFLIICWQILTRSDQRGSGALVAVGGIWMVGAAIGLALVGAGSLFGAIGSAEVFMERIAGHLLRMALVWLPIVCLCNAALLQRRPILHRIAALLVAWLMQASVVPASLRQVGVGAVLTSTVFLAAVALASSTSVRGTNSPTIVDADRNPG